MKSISYNRFLVKMVLGAIVISFRRSDRGFVKATASMNTHSDLLHGSSGFIFPATENPWQGGSKKQYQCPQIFGDNSNVW